ncbi:MAG TPA: flap endonuclease [Pseudomonadaceae bacterium]|nr:flap endonuclease [Pseudomonadaceae bacterium]
MSTAGKKRVYLVDSSIYIFRAWHVFDTSIVDRDGRPANAVIGFADFLYQLLKQEKPEYIACAFDSSQTDSYRRQLYPAYKANRDPAPAELHYQFAQCRELCRALGIAEFGSNRYEADDIIGSLATRYRQAGYAVTVVSADKDLTQVVVEAEDRWWDFARGTVLDQHGIRKHFGVVPQLIADMLALSGDKVDNIPGIPGIGYATAARILQKYPGVEQVLNNPGRIAEMKFRGAVRIQALLDTHGHILPLNKLLTTVYTAMDFAAEPDLGRRGVCRDSFAQLAERLSLSPAMQQRWLGMGG